VVVPLLVEDRALGALYFTQDAPCDFSNIQDALLVRPNTHVPRTRSRSAAPHLSTPWRSAPPCRAKQLVPRRPSPMPPPRPPQPVAAHSCHTLSPRSTPHAICLLIDSLPLPLQPTEPPPPFSPFSLAHPRFLPTPPPAGLCACGDPHAAQQAVRPNGGAQGPHDRGQLPPHLAATAASCCARCPSLRRRVPGCA
jgi:hypothetical protein